TLLFPTNQKETTMNRTKNKMRPEVVAKGLRKLASHKIEEGQLVFPLKHGAGQIAIGDNPTLARESEKPKPPTVPLTIFLGEHQIEQVENFLKNLEPKFEDDAALQAG